MEDKKTNSARKNTISTYDNITQISRLIVNKVETAGEIIDKKEQLKVLTDRLGAALRDMDVISKRALHDPSALSGVEGAAASVLAIQTEIYGLL